MEAKLQDGEDDDQPLDTDRGAKHQNSYTLSQNHGEARGATQCTLSQNHQMLLKENRPRVNIAASGDRRRRQREA